MLLTEDAKDLQRETGQCYYCLTGRIRKRQVLLAAQLLKLNCAGSDLKEPELRLELVLELRLLVEDGDGRDRLA